MLMVEIVLFKILSRLLSSLEWILGRESEHRRRFSLKA